MTRPGKAMIVGGPHDGKIVDVVGPEFFEPVSVPFKPYDPRELPNIPVSEPFIRRVYDLYRWSDHRGVTEGWRYVLRSHRDGLVRAPKGRN